MHFLLYILNPTHILHSIRLSHSLCRHWYLFPVYGWFGVAWGWWEVFNLVSEVELGSTVNLWETQTKIYQVNRELLSGAKIFFFYPFSNILTKKVQKTTEQGRILFLCFYFPIFLDKKIAEHQKEKHNQSNATLKPLTKMKIKHFYNCTPTKVYVQILKIFLKAVLGLILIL